MRTNFHPTALAFVPYGFVLVQVQVRKDMWLFSHPGFLKAGMPYALQLFSFLVSRVTFITPQGPFGRTQKVRWQVIRYGGEN
jgi:hypothetical protein